MYNTNAAKTGSAYDVLFNDRKYKDLLDKVDEFLEETFIMYQRGYRLDAIDEKQKPKVTQIENEFKQFASDKIKNIESRLEEIEKESTTENISNPQAELINRQNLKARLSFYDNSEIIEYVRNADPKEIGVYELSLLQNIYENRFSENEQGQISGTFTQLKRMVLHPYENDEEYNDLAYQYNILRQIGMENRGSVINKDKDGYVVIKPLADRYNEQLKYAKAKKDGARKQAYAYRQ
ncbi:hypothetical protein ACUXHI_002543 [Staphylococcus haemolyticus]|uniref:hypothetical protein n=1 Tax=Staphylococcus haemolyticus TaxID=1283 RepID=UPI00044B48B6|nr:hypothetical protein [Staphylococcus haemolyticus]EZI36595.1 hypothetical protein BW32_01226 [Staphylococcus haemolyticus]